MHDVDAGFGDNRAPPVVSDGAWHLPPTLGPGAHAWGGPCFRILVETMASRPRHCPEAMRDQVDSFVDDGKLTPPFKQFVRQAIPPELDRLNLPQSEWPECG